jgi:hypothetical protein
MAMDNSTIVAYIRGTFSDLFEDGDGMNSGWGEHAFYYNPGSTLQRGVYFLTIKSKPTAADFASAILVNGAYRLNVRISAADFERRFGRPSRWLKAEERPDPAFDYRIDDQICPDPTGWWTALSVLNPSQATFESLKPTIRDAYQLSRDLYAARVRKPPSK